MMINMPLCMEAEKVECSIMVEHDGRNLNINRKIKFDQG